MMDFVYFLHPMPFSISPETLFFYFVLYFFLILKKLFEDLLQKVIGILNCNKFDSAKSSCRKHITSNVIT
jgi:hypothetical protein